MVAVSDHRDTFEPDVEIVVITFTAVENVKRYGEINDVPFRILVDPDRRVYMAYGLGRGSYRRVYGWSAARRYFQIFREHGFADLRRATDDTLQLGGDFVINAEGVLTYGFWGAGPDDRPTPAELVAAAR